MSLRFIALLLIAALAVPALAEERQTSPTEAPPAVKETPPPAEPAAPAPTMRDLLNEGYEIKTVSVVPQEIVARAGASSVDAAIVILQKGPAIASCYTVFSALTDGSLVTLPCNVSK